MNKKKPILSVKNLEMHFTSGKGKNKNTLKAVDVISFDIFEGETFGLVGESGCGKTTTGRTIIRLYDPTGGEVIYKNKDITGKMGPKLRKFLTDNMAMIFQDPISSLNPRMTVREIIGEGLKVRGIKNEDEIDKMILNILNKVGMLPEHASRYPHEFSGGQRQRIGIARALIVKPSFIIADEPISALDVSVQAQVINLLVDLKKELNLTILFIAHDLSVVKYFSDRIGVMYFGKLVELGDSDEIYNNPIHPYTKSLLSAVPQPDPRLERKRKILNYDSSMHDYSSEEPKLHEITKGHFVLASDSEIKMYKKNM